MKKYLYVLIACCSVFASPVQASPDFQKNAVFHVREKQYSFCTCFEMDSPDGAVGTVIKSLFRVRTNYDLYDGRGKYEATGVQQMGWGAIYAWAIDIDVYDTAGYRLGMIDGQFMTTASAKYNILDEYDDVIAVAYLDNTNSGFTISYPDNEAHWIARLTREFVEGTVDAWNVKVYEPGVIRPEILKVFAAFAVDNQEYFKEDK